MLRFRRGIVERLDRRSSSTSIPLVAEAVEHVVEGDGTVPQKNCWVELEVEKLDPPSSDTIQALACAGGVGTAGRHGTATSVALYEAEGDNEGDRNC